MDLLYRWFFSLIVGEYSLHEDYGYISARDYGYDIMVISQQEITAMISGIRFTL
jgi:hypothetical protein